MKNIYEPDQIISRNPEIYISSDAAGEVNIITTTGNDGLPLVEIELEGLHPVKSKTTGIYTNHSVYIRIFGIANLVEFSTGLQKEVPTHIRDGSTSVDMILSRTYKNNQKIVFLTVYTDNQIEDYLVSIAASLILDEEQIDTIISTINEHIKKIFSISKRSTQDQTPNY